MVMKKVKKLRNKADAVIISAMMKKRDGGSELVAFVALGLVVLMVCIGMQGGMDDFIDATASAMKTKALGILGTS